MNIHIFVCQYIHLLYFVTEEDYSGLARIRVKSVARYLFANIFWESNLI